VHNRGAAVWSGWLRGPVGRRTRAVYAQSSLAPPLQRFSLSHGLNPVTVDAVPAGALFRV